MLYLRTTSANVALLLVFVLMSGIPASGQERASSARAQQTPPNVHNGKIAFAGIRPEDTSTTNNWEIYTVDSDGSGLEKITSNPTIDVDPAWSRDGKKIAFMRNDANVTNGGSNEDIYVMNAAGTGQKKLTDESGDDSYPTWSPDGSKIAFTSNRANSLDIFVMDADGGNVRRLTDNARYNVNPSWSPDGTKVAFQSQPPSGDYDDWEIYTINVNGTGEKALTNNQTADILPDWSPDGRRIVFQGDAGIAIMNSNGTEQRTILRGSGDPAWSPDGEKILFVGGEGISTIDPDGSDQAVIAAPPNLHESMPDWQPAAGAGAEAPDNTGAGQGDGGDNGDTGEAADDQYDDGGANDGGTNGGGVDDGGDVNDPDDVMDNTKSKKPLPPTGGVPLLGLAFVALAITGVGFSVLRTSIRRDP